MIVHNIDQRSEEWYDLRKGKMTASNASTIAANGKGLETYIYGLMAEKYSNNHEDYKSKDMLRGVELEDQARMTYEIEYSSVQQVGFVEMDEYTGCSPDGLVGDYGGIEIKCPNDANYFRLLIDDEKAIDSKYIWQVQMCLLITGREKWDLVFYNTNFEKSLIVFSLGVDTAKQEKLLAGIKKGKNLIQEIETKFNK